MGSVLTMDQGTLLQHSLPIHNDYSLPSEADCIDTHFTSHAHHYQPTSAGGLEQLRRDNGLPHPQNASFAFTATNHPQGARFDRGVASDGSSYQTTSNLTDSSSGSFSTSPSSAASSLGVHNSYPGSANYYTGGPTYTGPVQPQQAFAGSYAARPTILDGSTNCMPPPPPRPSISTAEASEREAYASTPYLARTQLSPNTHPGFGAFADTPRSVQSTAALYSPGNGFGYSHHNASMSSTSGYGSSQSGESLNFPWPNLEILLDMTCEGQQVTPEVHAKVEKGFFLSTVDQKWTCYRRNYFSVACHFTLHPNITNGRMFLKRNNGSEQIMAMGMRLSAAVDGSQGKSIELIQHTPKRDNGPKSKIDVTKVSPSPSTPGRGEHSVSPNGVYQLPMSTFHPTGQIPGPYLPLQAESNGSAQHTPQLSSQFPYSATASHMASAGQHHAHTFERVQFKQATANNGKRRASQQYFHLIVELFANVQKENSDTPVWVKVAQRVSEKIVVRGRSPSHYQNEGGNGQAGRSGASGGGSYSTGGGGYGGMNAGGFRSSTGGYGSLGSVGGYRGGNQYGMNSTSDGSGSSPGSVDEGAVDDHTVDAVMSEAERADIQNLDGYRYYPGPMYDGIGQQILPPIAKLDGQYTTTDPRQYAVKAEYADAVPGPQWQVGGCSRFQGVESSRGYFPHLDAGYT